MALDLSDKDIELNDKLDKMIEPGMAVTKDWTELFSESLQYFFSDQLHGKQARKNWEWVIVNYIWPSAITEICKLSRASREIVGESWEPSDQDAVDVWMGNIKWLWQKGLNGRGMGLEQLYALLDKKLCGYCVSKFWWEPANRWDKQAKRWVGEIRYKLWYPGYFWVDPHAERIEDAECLGTQRWVRLSWAQHRWPELAAKLEEVATTYEEGNQGFYAGPHIRGAKSPSVYTPEKGGYDSETATPSASKLLNLIMGKYTAAGRPIGELKDGDKLVKIEEVLCKDYEQKTVTEFAPVPADSLIAEGKIWADGPRFLDTATGLPVASEGWPQETIRKYEEPIYPYGRFYMRAGGQLSLNPLPADQVWPYNHWNFIVSPHYLLPHMWQGSDSVQLYKNTQDMINITVSHLFNNLKMYGDPKVIMETGAVARNPRSKEYYKVGAGAGSVIKLIRGAIGRNMFKIDQPPALSPAALQLYTLFAQEYKNIMGLQSIARGEKDVGRMSATQSQWLAMSSNDRVRFQSILDDEWVRQCCEMIAELIQEHYDIGQMVRIVGEEGTTGAKQITDKMKNARFDISILPATMLPYDEDKRIERLSIAYKILNEPAQNPLLPVLLRELDVPGIKGLLRAIPAWQKWIQFNKVMEAVGEGSIAPEQASKIITGQIIPIAPPPGPPAGTAPQGGMQNSV